MSKQQTKTVHALSLPYPEPQWPAVTPDHELAILRFLLPLLQPIGDFRHDHVSRSKGRQRAGKPNKQTSQDSMPEWMPELYDHLTIGFNTTLRRLESLARGQKPPILSQTTDSQPPITSDVNLAVIFVCRNSLPAIMTSYLPLLAASSASQSSRAKLVEVSTQAEAKIAQALQQPRVGVLGIEEGAAGAETLLRFVLDNIDPVEVPWLEQASRPTYFPVKIQTAVTTPKSKLVAQGRKRKNREEG